MVNIKDVSTEEYRSIIASNPCVVVDFYADWCAPCRALANTLHGIANEKTDVIFVKVNAEQEDALAMERGIRGLPTVEFYKNGQCVEKVTGNVPPMKIRELINEII